MEDQETPMILHPIEFQVYNQNIWEDKHWSLHLGTFRDSDSEWITIKIFNKRKQRYFGWYGKFGLEQVHAGGWQSFRRGLIPGYIRRKAEHYYKIRKLFL